MYKEKRSKGSLPKYPHIPIPTECPKCKHQHIIRRGFLTFSGGTKVQQVQCKNCGYIWSGAVVESKSIGV